MCVGVFLLLNTRSIHVHLLWRPHCGFHICLSTHTPPTTIALTSIWRTSGGFTTWRRICRKHSWNQATPSAGWRYLEIPPALFKVKVKPQTALVQKVLLISLGRLVFSYVFTWFQCKHEQPMHINSIIGLTSNTNFVSFLLFVTGLLYHRFCWFWLDLDLKYRLQFKINK